MNFNLAEIRAMVRAATQHDDEDLAQESALRAVEAFRRNCDVHYPRALLRKIVHDTVIDHWRRRRAYENLDDVEEGRLAHPCTIEADLDRKRRNDVLRQAMTALSAKKRETIELFYSEERTVQEIARLQNKSLSAVKMDLLRSRRELSRIIATLSKKKSR